MAFFILLVLRQGLTLSSPASASHVIMTGLPDFKSSLWLHWGHSSRDIEGKVYKKIGFVPKLRSNELRALEDLSVGEKGQLRASRCILRHTIKDPGGVQSCQDSALQMS